MAAVGVQARGINAAMGALDASDISRAAGPVLGMTPFWRAAARSWMGVGIAGRCDVSLMLVTSATKQGNHIPAGNSVHLQAVHV